MELWRSFYGALKWGLHNQAEEGKLSCDKRNEKLCVAKLYKLHI